MLYLYSSFSDAVRRQMLLRLKEVGQTGTFFITDELRDKIVEYDQITSKYLSLKNINFSKIRSGESKNYLTELEIQAIHSQKGFNDLTQALRIIKAGTHKNLLYPKHLKQSDISRYKNVTTISYVYLMTPYNLNNNIAKFIADADYEAEDLNHDGIIDESEKIKEIVNAGMLYNIKEFPQMKKAFSGEISYDQKITVDKWGKWISVYVPVKNRNHKTIAIIGLDLDVNSEYNLLARYRTMLIIIGIFLIVITVSISFITTRLVISPLKKLKYSAEKIAENDYSENILLKTGDELEVLSNSFDRMINVVRQNQENLETQVKNRTLELEDSLIRLEQLKQKQDADYYLANLLAYPLNKNLNTSQIIQTEFYLEQKKKIIYRSLKGEIGGDLMITASLHFKNQTHCVFFINADAMGKSLQGAGGVVIIGSVINSILSPLISNKNPLNIMPENWLINVFNNLQKVYETFRGAMFVSATMGLINEESGKMIFINADHPIPVLYRDKTSDRMNQSLTMKKIGMDEQNEPILNTVYLKEKDYVFIGSDGKDDLIKNGKRVDPEERIFCRLIEKNNANLDKIIKELKNNYEIIDDISILKIFYKP